MTSLFLELWPFVFYKNNVQTGTVCVYTSRNTAIVISDPASWSASRTRKSPREGVAGLYSATVLYMYYKTCEFNLLQTWFSSSPFLCSWVARPPWLAGQTSRRVASITWFPLDSRCRTDGKTKRADNYEFLGAFWRLKVPVAVEYDSLPSLSLAGVQQRSWKCARSCLQRTISHDPFNSN